MIDELTPESVASEVKLLRDDANYDGTFLFVEGETDAVFFSNYINSDNSQIRFLLGKDNVLKLISLLEKDGASGFLAILDADFWHLEQLKPPSDNICITDFHDVEIMLLISPALEKVLKEYLPSSKLNTLLKAPQGIRHSILSAACHMGKLRWASYKYHLNLSFYADYQKTTYIDWENTISLDNGAISVNALELMDVVCPSVSFRQSIRDKLNRDTYIKSYDMRQLCNGHDAIFILYIIIKKQGRPKETAKIDSKGVEKALRLAYEANYFVKTKLYEQILNWQHRNGRTILTNV